MNVMDEVDIRARAHREAALAAVLAHTKTNQHGADVAAIVNALLAIEARIEELTYAQPQP